MVSALIRDENNHILLVKNIEGDSFYWGLPGGAVEEGETLEQAVIREVKEETGYNIVITGLCSLREAYLSKREQHVLFVTFFAKVVGGELQIKDPDQEIAEVKWADIQTAKELMQSLFESLKLNSDNNKIQAFYAFEGIR